MSGRSWVWFLLEIFLSLSHPCVIIWHKLYFGKFQQYNIHKLRQRPICLNISREGIWGNFLEQKTIAIPYPCRWAKLFKVWPQMQPACSHRVPHSWFAYLVKVSHTCMMHAVQWFYTYQLRCNTLYNFSFHPVNNVVLFSLSLKCLHFCLVILSIKQTLIQ